jgi:type IV pilus assembly protein PilB
VAAEVDEAPRGGSASAEMRLGQVLLAEGLITEEQLARALDAQRVIPAPLGVVLVNQGAIHEDRLTLALSNHLEIPMADLKHGEVDSEIAKLVPQDFARRNHVLPVKRDNGHLAVAMSDPSNLVLLNDLQLITGLPVAPYIAGRSDILANLTRIHSMHPRLTEAARNLQESRPHLDDDARARQRDVGVPGGGDREPAHHPGAP